MNNLQSNQRPRRVTLITRLMLYTRLASPVAVCIPIRGKYTWLAWLANPNPNTTNPNPVVVVVVIFFQYNESIDIVDELVLNRIL